MKILGLDLSSVSSGWAVLNNGLLENLADCGVIKPKEKTHGGRLPFLEKRLNELIEQYKPDLVAVEDLYLSFRNPKVSVVLAYYHGIVKKVVWEHYKVEPMTHNATEYRRVLGAHFGTNLLPGKKEKLETGKDSKMLTFELIQKHFGLTDFIFKKHNDITDGLSTALAAHFISSGLIKLETKPNKKKSKEKVCPVIVETNISTKAPIKTRSTTTKPKTKLKTPKSKNGSIK